MQSHRQPQAPSLQPSRRAISLTEVLIAMGILTLGLLGVAALFPVGGYYMQRAEISDRGSQIGQAAMNQLVTSGMLDPAGWRMFTWRSPGVVPALPTSLDAANNSYQRPFAAVLTNTQAYYAGSPTTSDAQRQVNLARLFGHAFVIDPMVVSTTSIAPAAANNRSAGIFPASAAVPPSYPGMWSNWKTWWGSGPQYTWPIRRVTFPQRGSAANLNIQPVLAEHLFRGRDDLGTDLPDRDDRPAAQNWDVDKTSTPLPLTRQWAGDYSWMATVVPTTNAARDAMATNPESYAYDVSVVVFHKRVLGATAPQNGSEVTTAATPLQESEPYVQASVVSTGLNGGELRLKRIGSPAVSPYMQLKSGNWIAVCGPHPSSSDSDPRFVLAWYQVMSIDEEGNGMTSFDPVTERVVTLRGPEWPWLPSTAPAHLSNNLCVCIVRNAVAVHTRTLRLEGRRSTAFGGGGGGGGGGFWEDSGEFVDDFLR